MFTCPECGRTSHNPRDAAEGYCGACHAWTGAAPGWECVPAGGRPPPGPAGAPLWQSGYLMAAGLVLALRAFRDAREGGL